MRNVDYTFTVGERVKFWDPERATQCGRRPDDVYEISDIDDVPAHHRAGVLHHQWVYFKEEGGKAAGNAISGWLLEVVK